MTHKPSGTQQERILSALQSLQDEHVIPEEYLRRHPNGDGVSARYFKQVLLISECNGRISELRAKGHDIETSACKDVYGFAYHRLRPAKPLTMLEWFEQLPQASQSHLMRSATNGRRETGPSSASLFDAFR
jgi:hypothetical protein